MRGGHLRGTGEGCWVGDLLEVRLLVEAESDSPLKSVRAVG